MHAISLRMKMKWGVLILCLAIAVSVVMATGTVIDENTKAIEALTARVEALEQAACKQTEMLSSTLVDVLDIAQKIEVQVFEQLATVEKLERVFAPFFPGERKAHPLDKFFRRQFDENGTEAD